MRETIDGGSEEAGVARDMLAAGVVIADFEACFERQGGLVSNDFHKEWETVIAQWWELAIRYDAVKDSDRGIEESPAYMASIGRMSKLP